MKTLELSEACVVDDTNLLRDKNDELFNSKQSLAEQKAKEKAKQCPSGQNYLALIKLLAKHREHWLILFRRYSLKYNFDL